MKKIFISFMLFVLCLFSFGVFNADASPSDAAIRGYTLSDNWTYVSDITNDFKEVNGSEYYEGKMSSWMGVYKYLDETTNDLFVLVMCSIMMEPNQNSYWDQYRWNNQEMRIEFYPEISSPKKVELVNYGPRSSEGTMSWGTSVGVSGTDLAFSVTQSYSSPEIKVNTTLLSNQDNGIKITHSFEKYNTNKDLNSVCCDLVTKNNYAVFKIKNYSKYECYTFHIDSYATFFRYGVYNTSSVSDSQTYKFSIEGHKHDYTMYASNKNGVTHTASCFCGKFVIEPCFGFSEFGGEARCIKCDQPIK